MSSVESGFQVDGEGLLALIGSLFMELQVEFLSGQQVHIISSTERSKISKY